MTDEPTQYLEKLSNVGFRRFIGHVEKMSNVDEFVARGQLLGEVGLALDNPTPLDKINIDFEDLDVLLLMSVNAGLSGQEFLNSTLDKIKSVRAKSVLPIQVDGGINEQTIVDAKIAGANRFVTTSFLFSSPNPSQNFEKLIDLSQSMVS
jgi:ribulose-phosphate 3-epimerase